jgi:Domain of unknown function (DUF4412)
MRLIALLFLAVAARADWTIVQRAEGAMNANPVTLRLKDDKARVDISGQVSMLTNVATGDSVTINHNARVFMRIPAAEAQKVRDTAIGLKPDSTAENPTLKPAGRKEKVEGYECEIFTWSVGELKVTDWIARDYPNFAPILAALARFQGAGLASAARPLMPPLDQFPGMVIRREMNSRAGKSTTTLVSAKEEPLDAALFEVPKDYKEQPALQLPSKPEK